MQYRLYFLKHIISLISEENKPVPSIVLEFKNNFILLHWKKACTKINPLFNFVEYIEIMFKCKKFYPIECYHFSNKNKHLALKQKVNKLNILLFYIFG